MDVLDIVVLCYFYQKLVAGEIWWGKYAAFRWKRPELVKCSMTWLGLKIFEVKYKDVFFYLSITNLQIDAKQVESR